MPPFGLHGSTAAISLPSLLVMPYKGSGNSINVPLLGNVNLPFGTVDATTIGAIMFVRDQVFKDDPFLVGHEYIHVMQYAGNPGQIGVYLDECASLGKDCGRAVQPSEAIAYLCGADSAAPASTYDDTGHPHPLVSGGAPLPGRSSPCHRTLSGTTPHARTRVECRFCRADAFDCTILLGARRAERDRLWRLDDPISPRVCCRCGAERHHRHLAIYNCIRRQD